MVDNRLEAYTLHEITVKQCRQVVVDSLACEFQHGFLTGPKSSKADEGVGRGNDLGNFAIVVTVVTKVHVQRSLYLLNVTTYRMIVENHQETPRLQWLILK